MGNRWPKALLVIPTHWSKQKSSHLGPNVGPVTGVHFPDPPSPSSGTRALYPLLHGQRQPYQPPPPPPPPGRKPIRTSMLGSGRGLAEGVPLLRPMICFVTYTTIFRTPSPVLICLR